MTAILSDTLAPPRIARKGRSGAEMASLRYLISLSTNSPATQGLPAILLGTSTIEASWRWQVPKASLQ